MKLRTLCCLAALVASGCAAPPKPPGPVANDPTVVVAPTPPPVARTLSPTLQRLVSDAAKLRPLTTSRLTRQFLDATDSLPEVAPRTIYVKKNTREYVSAEVQAGLPAAEKATYAAVEMDETRYYNTKYGSPLAYLRALEYANDATFSDVSGKRIMDFGYGSIGHLRLLASLGADVVGVDPDSYLAALYSRPSDQGAVSLSAAAGERTNAGAGSITLAHGFWPKDKKITDQVGQGFDLIVSKNTLKRGYIKPERKVEDKRQVIDLGVSDEVFLATIFDALKPGGKLVIYNLHPRQAGPREPYKPMADGRSPFGPEQYEKAGFVVKTFDAIDHDVIRQMGRLLGWDQNAKGEPVDDLASNLFALVTVVARPTR